MKIIDNYFIKLFNNFTINPSMKTQSSILICNNNNKFPKQSKSIILKLNLLNPIDVQGGCVDKIEHPEPEQEEIIQKSLEALDKKIEETLAGKMEQIQEGRMEEGMLETLEKIEDMQKEEASAITIVPQIIGNNLTYNIILDHIKKYHSLYFILGLILFIKHK
jgi:hypothetical protein